MRKEAPFQIRGSLEINLPHPDKANGGDIEMVVIWEREKRNIFNYLYIQFWQSGRNRSNFHGQVSPKMSSLVVLFTDICKSKPTSILEVGIFIQRLWEPKQIIFKGHRWHRPVSATQGKKVTGMRTNKQEVETKPYRLQGQEPLNYILEPLHLLFKENEREGVRNKYT